MALLIGCSRTLPLTVPDGTPLRVIHPGADRPFTLQPGSTEYRALAAWIDHNRSGWSPYLATTPSRGIVVTGAGVWFQFLGSTALTQTPDGPFAKTVVPEDYSFLESSGGASNNTGSGHEPQ